MSRDRLEPRDRGGRPLPARLDPRAGQTTVPPRPRSGRALRTVRVAGAALSALLLAGTGWGWYLTRVAEASVNRTDAIPTEGNSGHHNGAEMNLLLVGDDSRTDLSPAQMKQLNAGADGGSMNTDTMILLHVPADGSRASFVSFPRDSYVQIPGHGWDKLNAAYADGYASAPSSEPDAQREAAGQRLLVQTISQLSGLQIDHFASVDLLGFFNLSNVVGGVQVNLCKAVSDSYSGAHFQAGVQTISGADALKFVRQRHGLPRGDLDRVVRQQVFIAGVARKMLSENVLLDPGKQQQVVNALAKSLTVDQSLDLMQLAQQLQAIKAGGVSFQTMPIVGDAKDPQGRDILKLPSSNTLHAFFADLGSTPNATGSTQSSSPASPTSTSPTVAPAASVKVQVLNGSGTTGLAAKVGATLSAAGFTVVGTGNATATPHTEIRYGAGASAAAATLAAAAPGVTPTASSSVAAGTVQLVVGPDWAALSTSTSSTASSAAPVAPAAATRSASAAGSTSVSADAPRTAADTSCIN